MILKIFLIIIGAEALKKFLNQSKDFVDFAFHIGSQKYSAESPKGRADMIEEILGLIKNIPDEIERTIRVKELAKITGIDNEILLRQMDSLPIKKIPTYSGTGRMKPAEQNASENAEKTLIKILLNQPEWASEISGCYNLLPESVKTVMDCCIRNDVSETSIPKLLNQLNNPEKAGLLTQILLKENVQSNPEITRKAFYDCVGILCRKFYEKRAKQLKDIVRTKIEQNQPCDKELEELNRCIYLTTAKNLEPFLSETKRSLDG